MIFLVIFLTDGHDILTFGETAYRAYTPEERAVIASALGHWDGPGVRAAAEIVELAHLGLLDGMLDGVDLIGFHGQTLAHAPRGRGTLQVGNGSQLDAGQLERE